ncbi:MAG: sodium/proton antiporter NhaB [Alphaproteobacteria bacterium]|nr:MAG: sodium/proton antiporter NhaB [Alphaproteobacteria bacterium]
MSDSQSIIHALPKNFMGSSALWYKQVILAFLVINPILAFTAGFSVAGWVLILEFIFTLAMALRCYPLIPGGLIAIEAVVIGLTSPESVYHELHANLEVILLLIFMVAGIYFMKSLLLMVFTKLLLKIRSKILLSIMFSAAGAFLSAFLDALTVTAVVIAIAVGFYGIYHRFASGKHLYADDHDHADDTSVEDQHRDDLEHFRGFLRNLLMHAAVGTALGGVMTLVGEPQNLLIASQANWQFPEFFLRMAPVTIPVLIAGLITCALVEKMRIFDYGHQIPELVRAQLQAYSDTQDEKRTSSEKASLIMQGIVALWLIIALAFHLAAVGLIGLTVIVFACAFTGVTDEHQIGHAFSEALPFTALLAIFFAVVAVIHDQGLFAPIIHHVLEVEGNIQIALFYVANGVLSAISDNVFVATVYINEAKVALSEGLITRDQFDLIAVAINTGTNIPSVATPNGQAAFLFLLTSSVAPLVRLSYLKMVQQALPYTIVMSIVGFLMVLYVLPQTTVDLYNAKLIGHHQASEIHFDTEEATGGH